MTGCLHETVDQERPGFGVCRDCGKPVYDDFDRGWMTAEDLRAESHWRQLWDKYAAGHAHLRKWGARRTLARRIGVGLAPLFYVPAILLLRALAWTTNKVIVWHGRNRL